MTPERVKERKKRLASWLREGLVKLGPTFIKAELSLFSAVSLSDIACAGRLSHSFYARVEVQLFRTGWFRMVSQVSRNPSPSLPQIGQQFSTRVDVLSPEFIKELELLQVGRRLVPIEYKRARLGCRV